MERLVKSILHRMMIDSHRHLTDDCAVRRTAAVLLVAVSVLVTPATARQPPPRSDNDEKTTARYFRSIRNQPLLLLA